MLKVLYDFVSSSGNSEIALEEEDNNLFDDDDDESVNSVTKTSVLDSVVDLRGESSLSWADLLRKMKLEMADMKFNQVPTLTTSKQLNINEAFTLVPESFNKSQGRKRSLLIGCNYNGNSQLKASHDDIRSMKVRLSIKASCMRGIAFSHSHLNVCVFRITSSLFMGSLKIQRT